MGSRGVSKGAARSEESGLGFGDIVGRLVKEDNLGSWSLGGLIAEAVNRSGG